MSVETSFDDWRYLSDLRNSFWPLPEWARFALSLGSAVARLPEDLAPTLTAVTVPTRGFSAALAATGCSLEFNTIESEKTTVEHLRFLRTLEPGRTVWCDYTHKRIDGSFCGFVQDGDDEYVQIQIRRGRERLYTKVPIRDAYRIQLASSNREAKRSRVVDRIPLGDFALAAFAAESQIGSRLYTVIVGQKSRLIDELTVVEFSILGKEGHKRGVLQDIVRAVELGSRISTQSFGTVIETPYDPGMEGLGEPRIVVFDGEGALMRKRAAMALVPHWIVFLDRTSRGFADGCDLIDRFYLERQGLIDSKLLPAPPSGVELISFLRGGRG